MEHSSSTGPATVSPPRRRGTRQNRAVTDRSSAPAPPGLWSFRDPTGAAVVGWLNTLGAPAPGQGVCLVPQGAPLLDRRSAVANVRLLLALTGTSCAVADIVTALRTVEIPDQLLHVRAARLSRSQRLAAWLGLCRLRQSRTVVMIEPFVGIPGADIDGLARLIRETLTPGRTILLVSVDATVGEACAATPVRDLTRTPW